MKRDDFWHLLEAIDQAALEDGSDTAAVAPVVTLLSALPPREHRSFENHLARSLFALDGEVFANYAGRSGDSGDGFLYCRCYVVAKGKRFFERVLADPSTMPNEVDLWCEALLFVAAQAWAQRTGRPPDDWPFEPSVSYETGSNSALWPPKPSKPPPEPPAELAFARAATRAGHAFRSKQYAKVVQLLTPHENLLSKKLLSMLHRARAEGPTV